MTLLTRWGKPSDALREQAGELMKEADEARQRAVDLRLKSIEEDHAAARFQRHAQRFTEAANAVRQFEFDQPLQRQDHSKE